MEILFLFIIVGAISGGLSADVAGSKGWDSSNWFVLGFLFGPFALIAIAGKPDKRMQAYLRVIAERHDSKAPVKNPELDHAETLQDNEFLCGELLGYEELWRLVVGKLDGQRASKACLEKSSLGKSTVILRNTSGDQIAKATATALEDGRLKWVVK